MDHANCPSAEGARRSRRANSTAVAKRVAAADWEKIGAALDTQGYAIIPRLLEAQDCAAIASGYADDSQFRSRIVMARHGFGRGEYKYFAYPLPAIVATLREALYGKLAPFANRWRARMRLQGEFPLSHAAFLAHCHAAGQVRPTPLLLRYVAGDYNCLHQDIYGPTVFPIQVAILLSSPGRDFQGGEFMLVEQRPRMQSRASVVPLTMGDAVAFGVAERPVAGAKGDYRVKLRHGVSEVREGERHTLGIIFHDAA